MLLALLGALGCDGPALPDGGIVDGGVVDARVGDAGVGDAGVDPEDAGAMSDAGADGGCFDDSCIVRFDALELLSDPYLPARSLPGRMRLASSRQPEPQLGNGNDDHDQYLRVEPWGRVLLEAEATGVVTRIWFTGREPASQDYRPLDQTVLHVEVDGEDVEIVPAGPGVPLGMLSSGDVDGFPEPWVADRAAASNAQIISVPIAFRRSIRLWIEHPPGVDTWVYYQVDWRELPAGTEVEPFDGVTTEAERAALEDATAVWVDRSLHVAAASTFEDATLSAFEAASVRLDAPTTVRALRVEGDVEALAAVEAQLRVDGQVIVDGPLLRLGFASPPTEPSDSALSTVAADALTFRYPFPVQSAVELRLLNTGSSAVPVRFGFEHDPGVPDADLGALRTNCGALRTPVVGTNFAILDLAGRRGHYAGQFLTVRSYERGLWVLEGDHEILSDGEWQLGTGLEDYFGGSFYYLRGPFALPLSGASGRGSVPGGGGTVSQYRHHLLDTVPFEHTFRFEYETFVAGADIEHCAIWYEAR